MFVANCHPSPVYRIVDIKYPMSIQPEKLIMNIAYVTANKLNVRRQPEVAAGNIMGTLGMGDKVENIVDAYNPGWALVTCRAAWTTSGRTVRRGYVSKQHLRSDVVITTSGRRYVTATSLNVRSEPRVSASSKIGTLRMAAPVEFLEKTSVSDLVLVECEASWTTAGPKRRRCYVSNKYLRGPARASVEALVQSAYQEWQRFGFGTGLEHVSPFYRYVGEMWSAINQRLNGKDKDVPWSAAAISFMVRKVKDNYSGFKYSTAHWTYLNDAISDKINNRAGPFWGCRITDKKPEVGDIVGKWRKSRITYDSAYAKSKRSSANDQAYASHSDIVVAVTGSIAYALGGNVGDSVNLTRYPLDRKGYLANRGNVFVLLKNKAR